MIALARDIPIFRRTIDKAVRGEPDALLLVEFAGDDKDEQIRRLKRLVELMGDLGFPGAVVEAVDPAFQRDVWEVRKSGLNIMMSMKGDGKPISFIEDCAVALEDLADYTDRLTRIFEKHGTKGTWRSEEHTSALQSLMRNSYAVFCLKKTTTYTFLPKSPELKITYIELSIRSTSP